MKPGSGQGDDAVPARLLMCAVLSTLHAAGWILAFSTDISKKELDKDTLIFKKSAYVEPSIWCSISFNRSDRLRIIGAAGHGMISDIRKSDKKDWRIILNVYTSRATYRYQCAGPELARSQRSIVREFVLHLALS